MLLINEIKGRKVVEKICYNYRGDFRPTVYRKALGTQPAAQQKWQVVQVTEDWRGEEPIETEDAPVIPEPDDTQDAPMEALGQEEGAERDEPVYEKEDGVYLIRNEEDLARLAEMVDGGEEVEPFVPAASASYRLTQDLDLRERLREDWIIIGNAGKTFQGIFDGDGHEICGTFPTREAGGMECLFATGGTDMDIRNLTVRNGMQDGTFGGALCLSFANDEKMDYLLDRLERFPEYDVSILVDSKELDTQNLSLRLKERWEQGGDAFIEVEWCPMGDCRDFFRPACMEPVLDILAPDMQRLAVREGGQDVETAARLCFLRLERVRDLECLTCQLLPADEENWQDDKRTYWVRLQGLWEGKDIGTQCLEIPFTEMSSEMRLHYWDQYRITGVDINFDGTADLLIHEGGSGGSGGSWWNYRAIAWDPQEESFSYFPSFPGQLVFLDFEGERMITRGRGGAGYEYVTEYRIREGEYTESRELILKLQCNEMGEWEEEVLSYYEYGELISQEVIEGWGEEAGRRYPDLNFWMQG